MMRIDGDDDGETRKFVRTWLTVVASVCYCYFVTGSLPKGKIRVFSLLPVFSLFAVLPLSLSTVLPAGLTGFFITWLASFKLLLFAFDCGPLSSSSWSSSASQYRRPSLFLFVLLTCFPVKVMQNQEQQRRSHETPKLPLNLPSKLLIFALSLPFHDYKHRVHPTLVLAFYCCMLYLFLDVVVGVSDLIVRPLLGVELDRPSDEPYVSTSLQDFWGRRWNLTVTNALRHTVYVPIKSLLSSQVGSTWAEVAVAVLATFLVSGLMHEVVFYYMTRAYPSWEVTWFFVLHGACVAAEVGVKAAVKASGKEWRMPAVVAAPVTVGFVVATAAKLFFPPITRNQTDARATEECRALVEAVLKLVR